MMTADKQAEIEGEIAAWLGTVPVEPDCDDVEDESFSTDVRVYLTCEDGVWSWRGEWGDASYDQDHRGYCGASCVAYSDKGADHKETAHDLVEQGLDQAGMEEDDSNASYL